jgi:hypothetical protein
VPRPSMARSIARATAGGIGTGWIEQRLLVFGQRVVRVAWFSEGFARLIADRPASADARPFMEFAIASFHQPGHIQATRLPACPRRPSIFRSQPQRSRAYLKRVAMSCVKFSKNTQPR